MAIATTIDVHDSEGVKRDKVEVTHEPGSGVICLAIIEKKLDPRRNPPIYEDTATVAFDRAEAAQFLTVFVHALAES